MKKLTLFLVLILSSFCSYSATPLDSLSDISLQRTKAKLISHELGVVSQFYKAVPNDRIWWGKGFGYNIGFKALRNMELIAGFFAVHSRYEPKEGNEKDKKEILVGVKIYPGFSSTWWNDYSQGWSTYNFSPKITLNGGVSFLKEIKKNRIYIEAELLSLNRGYKLSIAEENKRDDTINVLENNYYLTVPISVLFKLKWFYVGCGVNMAYRIKIKQIINDTLIVFNSPVYRGSVNWKDSKLVYGIQLKIGANVDLSPKISMQSELFMHPTLVNAAYLNYGLGLGLNYKLK